MYLLWWVCYSSPKRVTDLIGRACNLLWRVYYSSPKRVTDLFGRVCICCGGCTIVVLRG